MRLSQHGLRILNLLLQNPRQSFSGADFWKQLGVSSGTMYPLLYRLESAGWLSAEWEKIDPSEAGRPRKRLYRLTSLGRAMAKEALAEFK